ncbi:hypothetical protein QBC32DRAFT_367691 [Pseudoneurospora amorphoporcata]|uniref:Uncharacterized protein n=1 Tax=Pseudoneurospora amorphoporcata TaxID=241081 RepID=A0AAN6P2X2_9PEZI|nr:hypothetical protein QBC32DRAFT_367691 [Pseudoneurospora amorphoporcata]
MGLDSGLIHHSFNVFNTFMFFCFFFSLIFLISPASCASKDYDSYEAGLETLSKRWTIGGGGVEEVPELAEKSNNYALTQKTNHDDTPLPLLPSTTITTTSILLTTSTITPPPSFLQGRLLHGRQNPDCDNANAIADLQSQIGSLSSQLSALSSSSQSLSHASQQKSQQLSQSLQQASQSLVQASQRLSQTEQSLASARITQQAAEQASRSATQAAADMSRQMTEMSRSMGQSAIQEVSRVSREASQSAEERVKRVVESLAAVGKDGDGDDGAEGGKGANVPVLLGAVVGGVVGSSVLTGLGVVLFMRRGGRRRSKGRVVGEKEGDGGGEVIYVGPGSAGSGHDIGTSNSRGGSSSSISNSRTPSTRDENVKSYPGSVICVASTDSNTPSTAGSGTRVASPSILSTSAGGIKLVSDYEDESVYNDGDNGGPPPSSRGARMEGNRTALSPPPPAIPPRARSRSRPAPAETTAPPAFIAENPVPPAPVAPAAAAAAAAAALLSPFPPRLKSVRSGVDTVPVRLKDRQSISDEARGVGCAVSYYSPGLPPPPVRPALGAPKWAPLTIPGYGDDAKPLSSSGSGFKLDNPPPPGVAAANKRKSRGARDTRLSIFPGPSPSLTPSTQGWSSSPLTGTEEEKEERGRGRPSQKRQQTQPTKTKTQGTNRQQTPSPIPTLEAWLKRGMSSTRVPVRTGRAGPSSLSGASPRSAPTSNLRRQSYTARLREQAQQQHLLGADADDGGRGEDRPIRQS